MEKGANWQKIEKTRHVFEELKKTILAVEGGEESRALKDIDRALYKVLFQHFQHQ